MVKDTTRKMRQMDYILNIQPTFTEPRIFYVGQSKKVASPNKFMMTANEYKYKDLF